MMVSVAATVGCVTANLLVCDKLQLMLFGHFDRSAKCAINKHVQVRWKRNKVTGWLSGFIHYLLCILLNVIHNTNSLLGRYNITSFTVDNTTASSTTIPHTHTPY